MPAPILLAAALWPKLPNPAGFLPAVLAAVSLALVVKLVFALPVATIEITSLTGSVYLPDLAVVTSLPMASVLGAVAAITLFPSAGSIFGAAAVDRLHNSRRTSPRRAPAPRRNPDPVAVPSARLVAGTPG